MYALLFASTLAAANFEVSLGFTVVNHAAPAARPHWLAGSMEDAKSSAAEHNCLIVAFAGCEPRGVPGAVSVDCPNSGEHRIWIGSYVDGQPVGYDCECGASDQRIAYVAAMARQAAEQRRYQNSRARIAVYGVDCPT